MTPWTAACQASLSFTTPQRLLRFVSIELVMLSNHLILCCPLLFLPSEVQQGYPQFSSVAQSCLTLCNPMNCTCQASLSITNSWSLPKLTSIESVMPSSHLILCPPLFLLPSIFPRIRVFSNDHVNSSREVAKVLEFQLQHQSFQ